MDEVIFIGSDPELFLERNHLEFISSIDKIGGSKDEPLSIGNGCAVQEDNVAVEFNTPPADNVEMFIRSINYNLDYLAQKAKDMGLKLAIVPSAVFSPEELSHPKAKIFGCDPDYNAWTERRNKPPKAKNPLLRSAGGHVHVGCSLPPYEVAKSMDLHLGVPSVILDPDTRRRELYGKAGACRPKPYGVEYRVLSNFWIKSDELKKWVYQQTLTAVNFTDQVLNTQHRPVLCERDISEAIQYCINDSDVKLAEALVKEYGIKLATNL